MRYLTLYLSLFLMGLTFSSCSKERETIIPQGSEVNEATVFKFNNESNIVSIITRLLNFQIKSASRLFILLFWYDTFIKREREKP